jgi:hypothetical protein
VKPIRSSALILSVALGLHAPDVAGQAPPDVKLEARARFQAGLAAAQNGDLTAALSEFEAAYAAQPHFSVLYNIGRARAGLGRHVDAIVAFERYLAEGGARLDDARKAEVHSLLDASRRQVGTLEIVVAEPEATRVWLDGKELSPDDVIKPRQLPIGAHHVIYSIGGSAPLAQTATVRPSTTTSIELLESKTDAALAKLRISCDVPGVDVFVNGYRKGRTPLADALDVPAGELRVRFFRPGYEPSERPLNLRANASALADCAQQQQATLPRDIEARLKLSTEPRDASAFVDGKHFAGAPLPSGIHQLTVTRDGFLSISKSIVLPARRTTEHLAILKPTPSHERLRIAAVARRHRAAYALAGVGAALLAASAGAYVWNSQRYEDWRSTQDRNLGRALSIQRIDDLALGLLFCGLGLGTGATWLFLSPPSDVP